LIIAVQIRVILCFRKVCSFVPVYIACAIFCTMSRRREFAGLLLRYFYSLACRTSHSRHVYTHREKSLIFVTQQSLREWQFSFTVTRRRQNHILFRQPHKQVALQLAEGTIRFHPQLLFMFAFQNSNAEGAAMRLQNHTWSA